jgi:hypothetical protein
MSITSHSGPRHWWWETVGLKEVVVSRHKGPDRRGTGQARVAVDPASLLEGFELPAADPDWRCGRGDVSGMRLRESSSPKPQSCRVTVSRFPLGQPPPSR